MQTLHEVYTDLNSLGYLVGSPQKLLLIARHYGVESSLKQVKNYLSTQSSYTRNAPALLRFPRKQVISWGVRDLLQCDLAQMTSFSRQNHGTKYILICYLYFSKLLLLAPLKSKKSQEVADVFKQLIETHLSPTLPARIQTDKGGEFLGAPFRKVCLAWNATLFQTDSPDVKASAAEVMVREVKRIIYRHMSMTNTGKYVAILPYIMNAHNRRISNLHGFRPVDVDPRNASKVFARLYPNLVAHQRRFPKKRNQIPVNAKVRISLAKHPLIHRYANTFSEEQYKITRIFNSDPITYALADADSGEPVLGVFYHEELKLVDNE